MSPDEAEAVIAHEVSHIANGDGSMTLIQGVVNTFVIFICYSGAAFMGLWAEIVMKVKKRQRQILLRLQRFLELVFGILAIIITMVLASS